MSKRPIDYWSITPRTKDTNRDRAHNMKQKNIVIFFVVCQVSKPVHSNNFALKQRHFILATSKNAEAHFCYHATHGCSQCRGICDRGGQTKIAQKRIASTLSPRATARLVLLSNAIKLLKCVDEQVKSAVWSALSLIITVGKAQRWPKLFNVKLIRSV